MQKSTLRSRQTMNQWKGNHRRTELIGKAILWGHEEYSWHSFVKKRRFVWHVMLQMNVSHRRFYFYKQKVREAMKKLLQLLCIFTMCLSFAGCTAGLTDNPNYNLGTTSSESGQEEKTVYRIGMECDYAPNNWQEDTETSTNLPISNLKGFYAEGYDVQMAKKIAEEMDIKIEIVKLAWTGLIQALKEGQIDMIIAGMGDTPERKESIAFSNTYSVKKTEYVLVVQANSKYANADSIQDFSGATVVGQINTYYDSAIDQINGVIHAPAAQDVPNMTSQLQEGLVDALILDDDTAESKYEGDENYTILHFKGSKGFQVDMTGACVGMRLEDTELVKKVNKALSKIDSKTRAKLMEEAKANQPK